LRSLAGIISCSFMGEMRRRIGVVELWVVKSISVRVK
jgi:hypothetical protein